MCYNYMSMKNCNTTLSADNMVVIPTPIGLYLQSTKITSRTHYYRNTFAEFERRFRIDVSAYRGPNWRFWPSEALFTHNNIYTRNHQNGQKQCAVAHKNYVDVKPTKFRQKSNSLCKPRYWVSLRCVNSVTTDKSVWYIYSLVICHIWYVLTVAVCEVFSESSRSSASSSFLYKWSKPNYIQ